MKSVIQTMLLVLLFVISHNSFAEWPEMQHPLGAKSTAVGSNMKLNGMPMQIFQVSYKQEASKVVEHYMNELARLNSNTPVGNKLLPDGGGLLMQASRGYLISLNILPQTSNSSTATISISDISGIRNLTRTPYEVRLPESSKVLSDMETVDEDKKGRHIVFYNQHNLDINKQQLIAKLTAEGYLIDNLLSMNSPHIAVMYFVGQNREARLRLTRTKDGKTHGDLITVVKG